MMPPKTTSVVKEKDSNPSGKFKDLSGAFGRGACHGKARANAEDDRRSVGPDRQHSATRLQGLARQGWRGSERRPWTPRKCEEQGRRCRGKSDGAELEEAPRNIPGTRRGYAQLDENERRTRGKEGVHGPAEQDHRRGASERGVRPASLSRERFHWWRRHRLRRVGARGEGRVRRVLGRWNRRPTLVALGTR